MLLNSRFSEFEIIVADQNLTWPADILIRKLALSVNQRVIWLDLADLGEVNARHTAVMASKGDIFLFLDDDIIIRDRDFLARHVANYSDPRVDAVTGREVVGRACADLDGPHGSDSIIDVANWSPTEQTINFPRNHRVRTEVACFCTCNASVRRSSFMLVGGFDENFTGASYGHDYDFAVRLAEAGCKIIFDPRCEVLHLQAPMGGSRLSDPRNPFTEKERALSGLIFVLRHGRDFRGRRGLAYSWVIRRTLLLKRNVLRPWRIPKVLWGLIQAWHEAQLAVLNGPKSRFIAMALAK